MIRENIDRIRASVADICRSADRDPQEIVIIGVTKYSDIQSIQQAVDAGLQHIAENRLQQAVAKYSNFGHITRHMIGHLQTNKVKQAVQLFDMIQSVDSLDLAKEIDRQCARIHRTIDVLLQVNTSGEAQKFGVAPDHAADLLKHLEGCPTVHVKGLMTIGPLTQDKIEIRGCFRRLHDIFQEMEQDFRGSKNICMQYLSMGMSDDYPIALEEGANMLRIGRAIFQVG
ncbi:MAG TPA: YggS family pyridoxal phosphate-dependent enzyme [Candidatus Omnitrophota bacterium]|mgnify:CR=1 FL=1|nr:YggS family pyridoxal phosphate-dependent enzyme [Candidatus Omnitrophota bacterium]HQL41106.1 YggS family pyridoxal phosphate-dependent enzyme [Candidatus Omnitrophota bacterium]